MRRPTLRDDRGMAPTLQRLVGVYDADGTVLGELSYFVKARLGRAHCSLCDITHGVVLLVDRDGLAECAGDPQALIARLRSAIDDHGLR